MAGLNTFFSGGRPEEKTAKKHGDHRITWLHYTKLHKNSRQYCDGGREELENLADVIAADGRILQNLIVRKMDVEEYELIAGHKRCEAARILVEERGMEQYAFLPCLVINVSDARSRFALVSSNAHHEKTPFEILYEVEEMRQLLEQYPEEFPDAQGGRMVERLARQLGMARSTVSEYRSISNNLGEKGMEAFREGALEKSAAVALASLPEQEQEQLLEAGKTSHKEIKKYKEKKKARPKKEPEGKQYPKPEPGPGMPGVAGGIDLGLAQLMLAEERQKLEEPAKYGLPEETIARQRVLVAALEALVAGKEGR